MNAYLTRPATSGPMPGLLFIYEVFGLGAEMKRLADELAVEGYAVMVPNLFDRGSWFSCVKKLMHELKTGSGQGVQDLIQARHWLAGRSFVEPERIAVMASVWEAALLSCWQRPDYSESVRHSTAPFRQTWKEFAR